MSSGTDSLIASLRNKQSQAASGKSVEEIEAGQINPPESKLAGPGVKVEQEFQTVVSTETGEMKNSKIGKPKVTVVKAEVKTDKTKGIGTLYIDCSPTAPEGDGVLYDFAWLARDAAIMIQNTDFRDQNGGTYRVQDYRQVHFGQGPAAVVQAVNEYLDAHPIQELVVFSLMPEAQICLATLMSRAGRIVRGVR